MLLKTSGSMKKSKRKSENTSRQMKVETAMQNLWDAAKAVLIEKFMAIQAFLKKQETCEINLTYHQKELEQTKPKISRRKEIIRIRKK